jgi:16S rRNA (cytidine1402-2'-O)-methyltransferase
MLERLLAGAGGLGLPLVLFEAPHRVSRLLGELDRLTATHPDLGVAACRELTKVHEEVLIGSPSEVAAALPEPRGEFTLVVSGLSPPAPASAIDVDALMAAARQGGLSARGAADLLRAAGVPRREAYRRAQSGKGSVTER